MLELYFFDKFWSIIESLCKVNVWSVPETSTVKLLLEILRLPPRVTVLSAPAKACKVMLEPSVYCKIFT